MADRNNNNASWRSRAWHVILGCSPVSTGCKFCWAAFTAYRQSLCPHDVPYQGLTRMSPTSGPAWTGEVRFREEKLREPYKEKGKLIWVGSMSDPFHEKLTLEQIARIYAVAAENPKNKFQFLTKRIERMHKLYTNGSLHGTVEEILRTHVRWPLPNTWEGTSAEDDRTAKLRLPVLLDTPSNYRFVSFQPMLDEMNVRPFLKDGRIRYAIIGAEAGPCCRPFDPDHIIDLQQQLLEAHVPTLTECYPL